MKTVHSDADFKSRREKIISFCWQHFLLLISLFIMTFGVAVCVRSMLGSSVISVLPYVFESAGKLGMVPALSIGQYTYIMNFVLVFGQILVLRRRFEWVQLFQLVIGFLFGTLIDLCMLLTVWLAPAVLWQQIVSQVVGCTILGVGIALEVCCGSVTMPGEGFPVAVSRVTGFEFPKVKICVDIALVLLGVLACYGFFGAWQWHIVGVGTLFAMFYVGIVVRFTGRHIGWFRHLLAHRPGFRRSLYGLARFIYRKGE
ncbi:MAG: DUF6198 family protein [Bacteroides sp.]|nr:DUF6198 family protein [Bacteroides sp.]MCM1085085.1 DUF6198 family protein [Bacteroides sp.]